MESGDCKQAGNPCPHTRSEIEEQKFPARFGLEFFPFVLFNSCLPENPSEKADSDITAMWIRHPYGHIIFDHKLMLSAREGSFKAKLS